MKFRERYNKLNKEQKEAVRHIEGPLFVIAGPGSGKTELLGLRVGNILRKTDTPPESILCLTFTEAAASNMKDRLVGLVGEEGHRVPTYTFHGLCKRIMENYPEYFFKGVFFDVADDATKAGILEDILKKTDHDNPLNTFHPRKGYVYLESIKEGITRIKESGLTVDEFKETVKENKKFLLDTKGEFDKLFRERVGQHTVAEAKELIEKLRKRKDISLSHVKPLAFVVADSLELALEEGGSSGLSKWKSKWTKIEDGKRVLKDLFAIEKMESLAEIYGKYKERMYEEGYYEFLDLLLDVALKMEEDESLKSELREKYLYLLVDEFQDTNGIQMRILDLLSEDKVDRRPNICVVGDDDQAIYRFQGAEISNILEFKGKYKNTHIVTLAKNYRSTQKIINLARSVILKGEERLESIIKEVEKNLLSQKGRGEEPLMRSFQTKEEEYSFVARKVKERIKEGVPAEEIAVIGRTHKTLKEAEPYLTSLVVPIYSERKEDVLEKSHVREIITMIRFATLFLEEKRGEAQELLPEILSFPFWEIKREKVMKVASRAKKEQKTWFECMEKEKETLFVANFLMELSLKAKSSSLEEVIDFAVGTKKGESTSPFKEFYFSKDALENRKSEYLDLLSSLKRFIKGVREYKAGKFVKAKDLVEFLEVHEKNSIPLLDKNPLITEESAVSLLTAHSAKGKEFDTVFVLNCQKEEWEATKGGYKMPLPANIPFRKAGEREDDKLRLFYVVLTRAKTKLYLTNYKKKEDGRSLGPLSFLEGIEEEKARESVNMEATRAFYLSPYMYPFSKRERNILSPLVKGYKLSVTGLNKFLNVAEGGPQTFLEEEVLRFPQKKDPSLSYGNVVHMTIREIYVQLKRKGKLPRKEYVLKVFDNYLKKERLSPEDFKKWSRKGKHELSHFYKQKRKEFSLEDVVEKNFINEGCVLGETEITGKIDKIVKKEEGKMEVIDFKTGEPLSGFEKGSNHEKIKGWRGKNQLIFYKILVETSREFGGRYRVDTGVLEFVKPTKKGEVISLPFEIKKEDEERMRELVKKVGDKIKKLDFPEIGEYKKGTLEEIKKFEDDLLQEKK